MQQHLFSRVNLAPERIHFLNGAAPDPEAECERYEAAIAAAGGIDLQLLGIGTNGHIGFNEPARELAGADASRDADGLHPPQQCRAVRRRPARVPHEALSMGMATILHARRIVLIATGKSKARCIERMVRRPDHDEAAGVVPAAAPRRRADARRRRREQLAVVSSTSRRSCRGLPGSCRARAARAGAARCLRRSPRGPSCRPCAGACIACGSVRPAFCMTIAALTFHFARFSSASAASWIEAGDDAEDAAWRDPSASPIPSARRPSGCRRSCPT